MVARVSFGGDKRIGVVKGRFPFRLGTTSYVLRADVLANVRMLAPLVDDVELLLFESAPESLPTAATVRELAVLAADHGVSYTVHLPLDAPLGVADAAARGRAATAWRRAVERTFELDPFAFVVHLDRDGMAAGEAAWRERLRESLAAVMGAAGAVRFAAETLDYPFAAACPVVEELGMSVCLDVGHLWAHGWSMTDHLARYGDRCRVVHLHGVRDGRDHRDLVGTPAARLRELVEWLRRGDVERVVTLELFGSEAAVARSVSVLEAVWQDG